MGVVGRDGRRRGRDSDEGGGAYRAVNTAGTEAPAATTVSVAAGTATTAKSRPRQPPRHRRYSEGVSDGGSDGGARPTSASVRPQEDGRDPPCLTGQGAVAGTTGERGVLVLGEQHCRPWPGLRRGFLGVAPLRGR